MAAYFFDSSALVKKYVEERGSAWVARRTTGGKHDALYFSVVTQIEMVSALSRRARMGHLTIVGLNDCLRLMREDMKGLFQVVSLNKPVVDRAVSFAEQHALRAYDAVQLASAIEVNTHRIGLGAANVTLVSSDIALNAGEAEEGLTVLDPNDF